nr:unnamed protein product [Callosobruchus chinensis]
MLQKGLESSKLLNLEPDIHF